MASNDLPDIRLQADSLCREDVYTDRKVGTITRLTPVLPDGSDDTSRPVVFQGQTQLLTPMGALPLTFTIEAQTLADAIAGFPAAAQAGMERTLRELQELRREAASQIVIPQAGGGLPGGPGGLPGGGKIQLR